MSSQIISITSCATILCVKPPLQRKVNKKFLISAELKNGNDDGDNRPPGYPNTIYYPGKLAWSWQKPKPKQSLVDDNQADNAKAWILNLIEFIHWGSFPLGFYVAWIIFDNASAIATKLDGSMLRVFFLILGLLTQVYGGGITGNMMHEYEGWQVAEFRNPLKTELKVDDYNNALLRSVAYQLLFSFQTVGLLLFTLGIFGLNTWTIILAVTSIFVAFVGPKKPRFVYYFNNQPVVPLPVLLFVVFIINAIINMIAYAHFFGNSSIIAPLLVALGGIIEGLIAESTFNQWWHFIAFAILVIGLGLTGVLYSKIL